MDPYGHVNNVQFLRYLEDARVAMLFGPPPDAPPEGEAGAENGDGSTFERRLVVVRHEIDYRRPLLYRPDPILIRTSVAALNAGTVTLAYEIVDDDSADAVAYASARSVLAAYDLEQTQPRRFTPAERRRLDILREPRG